MLCTQLLEMDRERERQKTRRRIMMTLDDAITDLLYYRRKEDDELPPGAIEAAMRDGVVTVDELVAEFRERMEWAKEVG